MEQHPVPQNVTTFQFRLIGDMTIKQFGYLAAGAILAFISYKLPLPFFFTWPLTILSALTGFGLAFVPIEERPMDIWIMAFIKNVYSPTQYVWQKKKEPGGPTGETPEKHATDLRSRVSRLVGLTGMTKPPAAPPATPAPRPAPTVVTDKHFPTHTGELVGRLFGSYKTPTAQEPVSSAEPTTVISVRPATEMFGWIKNLFALKTPVKPAAGFGDTLASVPVITPKAPTGNQAPVQPPATPPEPSLPSPERAKNNEVAALEANLAKLKKEIETTAVSEKRILELQKQLTEVLTQKDKLEREVSLLRQTAQRRPPAAPSVFRPAGVTQTATPTAPTVRVITPDVATKSGLPRLTTFPNVVTGIIKDGSGNLLSGVLVTVRDKNDIPLRALKTNKLGQFAASTPLTNGTYLIEVEDPRGGFTFDRVQISVTGTVMPAIEIFAKSQKQIDRDRLVREIFGNPKPT